MNAELSGWHLSSVETLENMFQNARQFTGDGLDQIKGGVGFSSPSTSKCSLTSKCCDDSACLSATGRTRTGNAHAAGGVCCSATESCAGRSSVLCLDHVTNMTGAFDGAAGLTPCNKRKIADAWKSNAVFVATKYHTDWGGDTCTVRFE